LIRPRANRSFTVRRSKSPFRGFSCAMRITPHRHARILVRLAIDQRTLPSRRREKVGKRAWDAVPSECKSAARFPTGPSLRLRAFEPFERSTGPFTSPAANRVLTPAGDFRSRPFRFTTAHDDGICAATGRSLQRSSSAYGP
jgi:hypothetical protein